MKKTILLFSTILLFAGLTFGQTPQKTDKAAPAPKSETAAPAKDPKAGCDKKDMEKCMHSKDAKPGCCAHDKKTEAKPVDSKSATDTKAPEKK
jgi:hypothetical protein